MMMKAILSALLLSSGTYVSAAQPDNDFCSFPTEIDSFPFTSTGTTADATADSWTRSCAGEVVEREDAAVWYKIEGVEEGMNLRADCRGVESEVQCEVLMTTMDCELGEFQCVEEIAMASSISLEDPIPSISIDWSAKEGEIYYIYLYAPNVEYVTGPGYTLSVSKTSPVASESPYAELGEPAENGEPTENGVYEPVAESSAGTEGESSAGFANYVYPSLLAAGVCVLAFF